MAVKVSRILGGALALGGVRTLAEDDVARIDGRPDEIYRRQMLADSWRSAGREADTWRGAGRRAGGSDA